jgi:hypothetical protein
MKAYTARRDTAPFILNLGLNRGEQSISPPSHFTPRNESQYTLNRRLSWPQGQPEHLGKQENLLSLLGIKPRIVQLLNHNKL